MTTSVDVLGALERLYARHDSMASGRAPGDSTAVHQAILERLAANRLVAEAQGWTSLALERVAGMGRLRLWGFPPSGEGRAVVPDWAPRRETARGVSTLTIADVVTLGHVATT